MSAYEETLEFMDALAEVRDILRDIHIFMERSGDFSGVSTSLLPFSGQGSFESSRRTSLNFSIDGELKSWVDANRKAIGFSLVVSHFEGKWTLDSEYGWSGQDVGWDPIGSSSSVYETARDLIVDLSAVAMGLRSSALEFLSDPTIGSGNA
jgi:uncharacterized protein YfiM (DUF2279 family)